MSPEIHIGPVRVAVPTLLAPMAAVTDLPFRTICEEMGAGLTITEFLSAAALQRNAEKTWAKLQPSLGGRPFGVQIFGRLEEEMAAGAQAAVSVGAHVIDINMGCPAKRVVSGACGSALMREPERAQALVRAVRSVTPAHIPVTVKHRAGWDERHLNAPEFACALVEAGAAMITVHGRTRTQGFAGFASLPVIAAVRKALPKHIPLIGNGDVKTLDDYRRMRETTGCDGVMIGRGIMGNPWLFRTLRRYEQLGVVDETAPSPEERLATVRRHLALVLEHAPVRARVSEIRKVCAWYSRGLPQGAPLRTAAFVEKNPGRLLEMALGFFGQLVDRQWSNLAGRLCA